MRENDFLNIPFKTANLDRYYIRMSIAKAIEHTMPFFKNHLLDIGSGKMPYKNYILQNSSVTKYIGLDIEDALIYDTTIKPDYTWDGIKMPFEDEQFETTFATEVLEHCPEPKIILSETYRVLKPGGCFFFTVPFLWNLHEVPHDEYRYTPFALKRLLTEAGFINIDLKATGGWHASMAQMLGLWILRSPISNTKRKILASLIKPIIRNLIRLEKHSKVEFHEGQMITGLSGLAFKK